MLKLPLTKTQVPSSKIFQEKALSLLKEGKTVTQIAQVLRLPISKIYYWRRYYLEAFHLNDGRRLYDDQFKQDVLIQIAAGTSISTLAQSVGVSKVTLFKQERHHQAQSDAREVREMAGLTEDNPSHRLTEENLIFPSSRVEDLVNRIRVLEKNALIKTLRILTSSV